MSDKPPQDGNDKDKDHTGSSTPNTPSDSRSRMDHDISIKKKRQSQQDDRAAANNQSMAKIHSSGRSIRNNHHSMDMNSLRQSPVMEEIALGSSKSKGKSISMDTMTPSVKTKGGVPSGNNNNLFSTAKESLMKGRIFRSNKVAPFSNPLEEVVTVSPVVVVPSACGGSRNPSCVHSQIVGDAGSRVQPSGSNDSMENICRICHDSAAEEKLITPCLCKGSMAKVHRTCLERWLGESGKSACEICGQEYNTVRVPKYRGIRSFISWVRHPLSPTDSRNLFFDLACFFILTPLACLSAWLCVLGAKHYTIEEHRSGRKAFLNETQEARASRDASNSTWTSVGLLSLTGTLVAAYYIWVFVAVRYHLQVWKEWQQRNFIVTIVPLANGDFSHSPPPARPRPTPMVDDDPDGSDSESSTPARRLERDGPHPHDGNNNSNVNIISSLEDPDSSVRRANNILQMHQSPNISEISDTALFYQSVYGVDSDESISEQAMIRLATLRSEYDAYGNRCSSRSVTSNLASKLEEEEPPKLDQDLRTVSKALIRCDEKDKDNNSNGPLSKSIENDTFDLNTNGQDGPISFDQGSSSDDTAVSVDPDDIDTAGAECSPDYVHKHLFTKGVAVAKQTGSKDILQTGSIEKFSNITRQREQ